MPVAAPVGTGTTTLVVLQVVGTAETPPNVTVLELCAAPKFVPEMVTDEPTSPEAGIRITMVGVTV